MFHKTLYARTLGLCSIVCLSAALLAAPIHALATPKDDSPATIGGKPVALTVTGEGEVNVTSTGYILSILFYDDAVGPEAVAAQNIQTETRLLQAAQQSGTKTGDIKFLSPRQLGIPAQTGFVGGIENRPPRADETGRAVRTMFISGRNYAALPALVRALQKVGAQGTITLTYSFDSGKPLRNQTLKKAVADAVEQTKILETASMPRHLQLLAMEPGDFFDASYTTGLPLMLPKSSDGGAPSTGSTVSAQASVMSVHQSVTLRYALADAPSPIKTVATGKPGTKTAPPKN